MARMRVNGKVVSSVREPEAEAPMELGEQGQEHEQAPDVPRVDPNPANPPVEPEVRMDDVPSDNGTSNVVESDGESILNSSHEEKIDEIPEDQVQNLLFGSASSPDFMIPNTPRPYIISNDDQGYRESIDQLNVEVALIKERFDGNLKLLQEIVDKVNSFDLNEFRSILKSIEPSTIARVNPDAKPPMNRSDIQAAIEDSSSIGMMIHALPRLYAMTEDFEKVSKTNSKVLKALDKFEKEMARDREKMKEEIKRIRESHDQLKDLYLTMKSYMARKGTEMVRAESMIRICDLLMDKIIKAGITLGPESEPLLEMFRTAREAEGDRMASLERTVMETKKKGSLEGRIKEPGTSGNGPATKESAESKVKPEKNEERVCFVCQTSRHPDEPNCPIYPNHETRRQLYRAKRRCFRCGKTDCRGAKHCKASRAQCRTCSKKDMPKKDTLHHVTICPIRNPVKGKDRSTDPSSSQGSGDSADGTLASTASKDETENVYAKAPESTGDDKPKSAPNDDKSKAPRPLSNKRPLGEKKQGKQSKKSDAETVMMAIVTEPIPKKPKCSGSNSVELPEDKVPWKCPASQE